MTDQLKMKAAIQGAISSLMDHVMNRVLVTDPFLPELHHAAKPIYAALVPDAIFKGSHFERRFVTPFGGLWEKLAVVAATEGLGMGIAGKRIDGVIGLERLQRIAAVLNRLEHSAKGQPKVKPDWTAELTYIMAGAGENVPVYVECDVYAEDLRRGQKFAFELKAPLPNSDQTKVSKEKLFKLYAMQPRQVDGAYFALPYNPYGSRDQYAWSFPSRWFNMQVDDVVLIGSEFWDKIGGAGTYEIFLSAINEIAPAYQNQIYRDYLGIEPPVSTKPPKL